MGRVNQAVPAALSTVGAVAFLLVLLFAFSSLFRPDLREEAVARHSAEAIAEALDLRDPDFPEGDPPRVQVPVDYSLGDEATWYPRGESPILAELVREGRLPPVAKRVGSEPMVMQGPEGIGRYGGTWLRLMPNASDLRVMDNRMAGDTLVRWSPLGYPIVPGIARGWEVNEDATEWTFHLRRGMRWSDGHPFTSEDILYRYEAEVLDLNLWSDGLLRADGELGELLAPDPHTIIFRFPAPKYGLLEELTTDWRIASPAHYLEPFHPSRGDSALIEEEMETWRRPTPRSLYNAVSAFTNPECPSLSPWILQTHTATPPFAFVRNPYYWAVDVEGNQLPYIDQVLFEVKDERLLPISAIGEGVHMQTRYVRFEDYTLLMDGRDEGNYRLLHWFPATRSLWTLFPNLNKAVPDGDETARQKRALLRDKRFRQALSLAIDRESIIRAEFSGIGEPSQLSPGRESFFHDENLMKAFTEYAPARANALLDELGLVERDAEGFRTFPDGSRMTWIIDYTQFTGPGAVQFVVSDWAEVGIRAMPKERNRPLFVLRFQGGQSDFVVWTGESEFNPMVQPRNFVPTYGWSLFAPGYGEWFSRGGMRGNPAADGRPEPEPGSDIRRAMELLQEASRQPTREGQREVFREIFKINAENIWSINIATPPPALVVVADDFRNVPKNALVGYNYLTPANTGMETFYFENANQSPEVVAKIQKEMTTITPVAGLIDGQGEPSEDSMLGKLIRWLLLGILIAGLLLVAIRHPFIGRRILWAIPTLAIISVISFTIIQLPPGSYLESLIIQLQATGDEVQEEEIEELRLMFHLDESPVQRYLRWVGLYWFISFDEADTGLLQGDLGLSMQTQQPVNEMVGDRLVLTVAISVGTILFTWLVALPIGVYSAVRQYSVGDYFFTLVGFIGLSVPNFLLALLLMFVSHEWFGVAATGLFSPEFAAQPGWSWPKFVDLLKHIWVPIVVLGTAGTAGMIRIMRGNLLDELQKPYVTTARAKGVRPVKLLVKYPIRLALNPFVSGIGGIFPTLISGGSIVAIVLSLPTVGPLLLEALLSEDMYLAASMLMILSLLTIFGILVSDLLLLALDPRIRMEGGRK